MITADIKMEFVYDKRGDVDLQITLLTLMQIRELFEKVEGHNKKEIETLAAAEHIINEIQRDEVF